MEQADKISSQWGRRSPVLRLIASQAGINSVISAPDDGGNECPNSRNGEFSLELPSSSDIPGVDSRDEVSRGGCWGVSNEGKC